jgi:hypothetical protein
VWFANDTIPRIVTLKMENIQYLLTSANIINSPLMGWVQYHMGAMHPYLPELEAPASETIQQSSWRYTVISPENVAEVAPAIVLATSFEILNGLELGISCISRGAEMLD